MMRPERWAPADGLKLEPNALLAAQEVAQNLALTAGPGAGKTEMLAQRADFLLRTSMCRYPKRILAISFKVDASQNLKSRVRKRCGSELSARFDSYTFHAFAKKIIDRFRVVLSGRDALDDDYSIGTARVQRKSITFADMVPLAAQIVETSDIARRAIQETYSHVFLDEFQDCTKDQYQLILACFLNSDVNLVAVGDTKQRIMGWAGALEGIFEQYAKDFSATPLNLYQNFRSEPRLRRMQNAMVKVMDPKAALAEGDLPGDAGTIQILKFADDQQEANQLASTIAGWIENGVAPAEVAILLSRQQELYCQSLRAALEDHNVPFREEDRAQDLSSEPIARLITDFLLVVGGGSQPAAYGRLLDIVIYSQALDDEQEYRARSKWGRFVDGERRKLDAAEVDLGDLSALQKFVGDLLAIVGRESVVALSADYEHSTRLQKLIDDTIAHLHEGLSSGKDLVAVLAAFSAGNAVRIMTIHKSKGLEFERVVMIGIEKQTFWGKIGEERSAMFVGISRAKKCLVLTACESRQVPKGAKRWDVERTPQSEFLAYAEAYM